jgi:hypothetical protein
MKLTTSTSSRTVYARSAPSLKLLFTRGQSFAIMACRRLRTWLSNHPNSTIMFHLCPRHAKVVLNQLANMDEKHAASTLPSAPCISFGSSPSAGKEFGTSPLLNGVI